MVEGVTAAGAANGAGGAQPAQSFERRDKLVAMEETTRNEWFKEGVFEEDLG